MIIDWVHWDLSWEGLGGKWMGKGTFENCLCFIMIVLSSSEVQHSHHQIILQTAHLQLIGGNDIFLSLCVVPAAYQQYWYFSCLLRALTVGGGGRLSALQSSLALPAQQQVSLVSLWCYSHVTWSQSNWVSSDFPVQRNCWAEHQHTSLFSAPTGWTQCLALPAIKRRVQDHLD